MKKDANLKSLKEDFNYHDASYNNWKEKVEHSGIEGISKINSDFILKYIFDMELGKNTSKESKRGARGYHRLIVLKNKLTQFIKILEKRNIKDVSKITEDQLFKISQDLEKGKIKNQKGEQYKCPGEFISTFKSFWNWYIKRERKNGNPNIQNITEDLSSKSPENSFVYFSKEQLQKLTEFNWFSKNEKMTKRKVKLFRNYKILCKFLFDSILRFPSEVTKLKVKNLYKNEKGDVCLNIDSNIGTKTKSSIRNFNLLFTGDLINNYIKEEGLKEEDVLFPFVNSPHLVTKFNKKLQEVAVRIFGNKISHPIAKEKYSKISGYDFRHCGAIYLRKIASETGAIGIDKIIMRAGWSDYKMINYYTKFLGLDGIIDKDAMLNVEDRSQMQNKIANQEQELKIQKNELGNMKNEIQRMKDLEEKQKQIMQILQRDKRFVIDPNLEPHELIKIKRKIEKNDKEFGKELEGLEVVKSVIDHKKIKNISYSLDEDE